jgi:serine phosphatase RsbU (regulator of sigma subunit)/pSer/pThr/pTyr-binding forkhead associated (FHA) protein
MPSLIVTSGVLAGQVFSFSDMAVVGRGQFSEVRLNDPTVSRRHALIRREGNAYELRDQDSANGTFYRGEKLSQPVPIEDGDELQFGEIKAVFRTASSELPSLAPLSVPNTNATGSRPAFNVEAVKAQRNQPTGLREMLARLKLFYDIGSQARQKIDLRQQLDNILVAIKSAFPQLTRASIFAPTPASEHLALLADRTTKSDSVPFNEIESFLLESLRREQGLMVNDADGREAIATRLRAAIVPAALAGIPLRLGDDVLGVLYLESALIESAWRTGDQELFVGIAGQLAWLMASVQGQSAERAVELHDLALARRIQQRFLPQSAPKIPGYRIADSYAAARVIGGDYYDFFNFRDGKQGFVIADVSGKAVSGALYMARISVQVRSLARHLGGPAELLAGLNHKLYQDLEPGMFVTMLAGHINPDSGLLTLANAGHPQPLMRSPDNKVHEIGEPGALPLGAMNDTVFRDTQATLAPGSCVLFYTDGLDEAHNAQKELFGKERVIRTLIDGGSGAQAVLDSLLAELARFTSGEPQSDDLTLVTLSRERS